LDLEPEMISVESALVHAGTARTAGDPAVAPLVPASIFISCGEPGTGPSYGRNGNPTWASLEQALGAVEQAEAVAFASGQAASMALMLVLSEDRGRIVLPHDGYYNTRELAARLRCHGVEPVLTDLHDLDAVTRELSAAPGVLWAETPTNPLLKVADLGCLGALAKAAGAPMVVDNTVATGLLQQPLEHGAVASVCSLTKSASGHSDLVLGAVITRDRKLLEELRAWRTLGGGIPGPFEAWLALRGLRTLPLRIARQSQNALMLARHLAGHPRVRAIHYPGTSQQTLAVARRQMPSGFGPLLSFEIDGTAADADAVVTAARLILPATSFGGAESTWERRARWPGEAAPASLIRLSAGIEPVADLIADLDHSLGEARDHPRRRPAPF
jgi:cystathionine gamma-synthase